MAHMIATPAQKKRGKDAMLTPGPKDRNTGSPVDTSFGLLSPAETATPAGSAAWGATPATPSPPTRGLKWGSAAQGDEDVVQALVALAGRGAVEEAFRMLRHVPLSELPAARHVLLEALLAKDALEPACNLAFDALKPMRSLAADMRKEDSPGGNAAAVSPSPAAPGSPLAAVDTAEAAGTVEADALPSTPPKAERREPPLRAASVETLLRALLQDNQHIRATDLLRAVVAAKAELPGDSVLNSMVDAAVRAGSYNDAWDVLELLLNAQRRADKYWVAILTKKLELTKDRRQIRRGIALVDLFVEQQTGDVDEIVFNSLLNVLGKLGDMTRLELTRRRMAELNVEPSSVTFGTIVKAYGAAKDFEAVLRVWREMRTRNLGMNPVTCGCVLDACVKCGQLEQAKVIFGEMKMQGLHKNTVLYATLIKGLAKDHDLRSAMHLFHEMRQERVPCNLVAYNSLMDVCVRCNSIHYAAHFLREMMQEGIQPDLITFSTLIKGYSHAGRLQEALDLAQHAKDQGLKCDEIMYNSLIDGCAKANDLKQGKKVFDEMVRNRVPPTNITFSILVRLFFDVGRTEDAFSLVESMAPIYRCAPTRVVYTALLRCCAAGGGQPLARAADLLVELASKRNSKLPDQGMLGAVLAGCAQHGDFQLGRRVLYDFAMGPACRRAPLGGMAGAALDGLKAVLEGMTVQGDERGAQELLQLLRQKGLLSTSVVGQLTAAVLQASRSGYVGGLAGQPLSGSADAASDPSLMTTGAGAEAARLCSGLNAAAVPFEVSQYLPSPDTGAADDSCAAAYMDAADYSVAAMPGLSTLLPPYMAAAANPYMTAAANPYMTAAANPYMTDATNPYMTGAANPFANGLGAPLTLPPYLAASPEMYAAAAAQLGMAAQWAQLTAAVPPGAAAAAQLAAATHLAAAHQQQLQSVRSAVEAAAAAALVPQMQPVAALAAPDPQQQRPYGGRQPLVPTVAPTQQAAVPAPAAASYPIAQPPRGGAGKGKGSQRAKENRRVHIL